MRGNYSTGPVALVRYRICIGGVQDREELISTKVKVTVYREERDRRGNLTSKPEKINDPIIMSAWSLRRAEHRAEIQAEAIIREDQRQRRSRQLITRAQFQRRGK